MKYKEFVDSNKKVFTLHRIIMTELGKKTTFKDILEILSKHEYISLHQKNRISWCSVNVIIFRF